MALASSVIYQLGSMPSKPHSSPEQHAVRLCPLTLCVCKCRLLQPVCLPAQVQSWRGNLAPICRSALPSCCTLLVLSVFSPSGKRPDSLPVLQQLCPRCFCLSVPACIAHPLSVSTLLQPRLKGTIPHAGLQGYKSTWKDRRQSSTVGEGVGYDAGYDRWGTDRQLHCQPQPCNPDQGCLFNSIHRSYPQLVGLEPQGSRCTCQTGMNMCTCIYSVCIPTWSCASIFSNEKCHVLALAATRISNYDCNVGSQLVDSSALHLSAALDKQGEQHARVQLMQ